MAASAVWDKIEGMGYTVKSLKYSPKDSCWLVQANNVLFKVRTLVDTEVIEVNNG